MAEGTSNFRKPSSVLHYTSLDVVKILLKNALYCNNEMLTFHATQIDMMNDLNEFSLLLDQYFTDSELKRELKGRWDAIISQKMPFVISMIHANRLSVNRGTIPMWKMYGDSAKGAYMKFSRVELANYCSSKGLLFRKCECINTIGREELVKYFNFQKKDISMIELADKSVFTKSVEWEFEDEWRIMKYEDPNNVLSKNSYGRSVKYIEVNIPLSAPTEICLGPMTQEDDFQSIKCLVAKLNDKLLNKIHIKKSKIKIQL